MLDILYKTADLKHPLESLRRIGLHGTDLCPCIGRNVLQAVYDFVQLRQLGFKCCKIASQSFYFLYIVIHINKSAEYRLIVLRGS